VGKLAAGNMESQQILGKIPGLFPKLVEMLTWDTRKYIGRTVVIVIMNCCGRVDSNRKAFVEANAPPALWKFFMETKDFEQRKYKRSLEKASEGWDCCCAIGGLNSMMINFPHPIVSAIEQPEEMVKLLDDELHQDFRYNEIAIIISMMNQLLQYDPTTRNPKDSRHKLLIAEDAASWFTKICRLRGTRSTLLEILINLFKELSKNPKYFHRFEPDQTKMIYSIVMTSIGIIEDRVYKHGLANLHIGLLSDLKEDFDWINELLWTYKDAKEINFNRQILTETGEKQTVCSRPSCVQAGKLLKCGRCKKVAYCGKDCQTKDWKRHKPNCVPSN